MIRRLPLVAVFALAATWLAVTWITKGGTEVWLILQDSCPPAVPGATYEYYRVEAGTWKLVNASDKPICLTGLYMVKIRSKIKFNITSQDVDAKMGYTYSLQLMTVWEPDPSGRAIYIPVTYAVYDAPLPNVKTITNPVGVSEAPPAQLYNGQKEPGWYIFDKGAVNDELVLAERDVVIAHLLYNWGGQLFSYTFVFPPPEKLQCQNITIVDPTTVSGLLNLPNPFRYRYTTFSTTNEPVDYPTKLVCNGRTYYLTVCLDYSYCHVLDKEVDPNIEDLKFVRGKVQLLRTRASMPPSLAQLVPYEYNYNVTLMAYYADLSEGWPVWYFMRHYVANQYVPTAVIVNSLAVNVTYPLARLRDPPPNQIPLLKVTSDWPTVSVVKYNIRTDWLEQYSHRYAKCYLHSYAPKIYVDGPFGNDVAWPYDYYPPYTYLECTPYSSPITVR